MRLFFLSFMLLTQSAFATQDLNQIKQLFDLKLIEVERATPMCVGQGYRCDNSLDCCGSAFCRDGACDSIGGGCHGEGAACDNSLDCCGSAFCRDGYCSSIAGGCREQGARCNSSLDCCGSLFCRNNFCD